MDRDSRFDFGDVDVGEQKFYLRRSYHLERFDDHIASLALYTADYAGSHESLDQQIINWDLRRARPFTTADVFDRSKEWEKFVIDYCIAEIGREMDEEPDRDSVGAIVRGESWRFGPDKAMLYVPFSAMSGFAGPGTDVVIPYTLLKPYLKADAPIL